MAKGGGVLDYSVCGGHFVMMELFYILVVLVVT